MDEKCVLIMDRTNWKWGKKTINILMLSIEHFGIAIPLFWTILDKDGTSSSEDRMDLLKRVIRKLGPENIKVLLADREFIGGLWFRFLIEEKIPFVIRVKQNFMAERIRSGYEVPRELLKELGRKKRHINHSIVLWGHALFASVEHAKNAKEPMIVVSNKAFPDPLDLYRWRWGIETLFGCLKSRGFRMEDTHMVESFKIEKLIFILTIAFCWAYKTGELKAREEPIIVKKHGRKAKIIFRLGLDLIRSFLLRVDKHIDSCLSILDFFRNSLCSRKLTLFRQI
jgi:transposase